MRETLITSVKSLKIDRKDFTSLGTDVVDISEDVEFTGNTNLTSSVTFDGENFTETSTKNKVTTEIEDDEDKVVSGDVLDTELPKTDLLLLNSFTTLENTAHLKFVLPKGILYYGDEFYVDVYLNYPYYLKDDAYIGYRFYGIAFSSFFDPSIIELVSTTSINFPEEDGIWGNVTNRNRVSSDFENFLEGQTLNADGVLTKHNIQAPIDVDPGWNLPENTLVCNAFVCSIRYRLLSGAPTHVTTAFDRFILSSIINDGNQDFSSIFTIRGTKNDSLTGKLERLGVIDDLDNEYEKTENAKILVGNYVPLGSLEFGDNTGTVTADDVLYYNPTDPFPGTGQILVQQN